METIAFTYDAIGRRTSKRAEGETTKYVYAGDMLLCEERYDENNIVFFGDDLITGDSFVEGGEIVIDSVNKSVIEYLYGQNGVAGLVYDGAQYYFRRNVQGDITRIYDIDGTLKACYTYDAWGSHKVLDADGNVNTDPCFIGNVNPFRYRGYYYDVETGLFFCASRYYDPEVGRWINADDISYLDPEAIGGLNLYAYCGNNPVMRIDPTGHAWWHWILGGLAVVGMAVLTVVTCGAAVAIAAGVTGAVVGGIYGGMTAVANGQNVLAGIGIGMFAGAFMGMGAAVAGSFIVPALSGTASFGGLSAGTSLLVGTGIAFGTGFAGGFLGDTGIQLANNNGKFDLGAAAWSGLQWGVLNTINAFTTGLAGNLSGFGANFALGLWANFTFGSIGMLIDILRNNTQRNKSTISQKNAALSYGY